MQESLQLESVNVGGVATITYERRSMSSGICKIPVSGPQLLGDGGVRGDSIVDQEHHGGPDQAVYVYSADDYDWWNSTSDRAFSAGTFGENLTIRGLPTDMNVGDRLLIGEVVLEATSPRIPCSTLAVRMKDSAFGRKFREAERPGAYCRVLSGGEVNSGSNVTYIPDDSSDVSLVELFRFNYALHHDVDDLQRYLSVPLASRFRAKVESRLKMISEKAS